MANLMDRRPGLTPGSELVNTDALIDQAIRLAQADPERALLLSGRALATQPDDGFTMAGHGIVLSAAGRQDEALDLARRATVVDPSSAVGWLAMVQIFRSQERDDEMLAAAGRAISVEPSSVDAMVTYCAAMLERLTALRADGDEMAPALRTVENMAHQALQIEPDSAESLALLAHVASERRQFDQALELVRRALAINPDLPRAHIVAQYVQISRGEKQEGFDHLLSLPMLVPETSDQVRAALIDTSPRPAFVRLGLFFSLLVLAAWLGGWWWLVLVVAIPAGVSGGMILMARRGLFWGATRRARRRAREVG